MNNINEDIPVLQAVIIVVCCFFPFAIAIICDCLTYKYWDRCCGPYRIKRVGSKEFYPQKRVIGFWHNLHNWKCDSFEEALKEVEEDKKKSFDNLVQHHISTDYVKLD